MSAKKLRLLAECLECNFMTDEDRRRWVSDLQGFAKDIERGVLVEQPEITQAEVRAGELLQGVR